MLPRHYDHTLDESRRNLTIYVPVTHFPRPVFGHFFQYLSVSSVVPGYNFYSYGNSFLLHLGYSSLEFFAPLRFLLYCCSVSEFSVSLLCFSWKDQSYPYPTRWCQLYTQLIFQKSFLLNQCCGSVTFLYGSGSRSVPIAGSIPLTYGCGSGSCSFRQWLLRCQQIQVFYLLFFKVHFHQSSKIKVIKKSQNRRNQGFSYFLCMVMELGRIRTNNDGSGSERLKNLRILRIRIHDTG